MFTTTRASQLVSTVAIAVLFGQSGVALAGGFIAPKPNPNPPATSQELSRKEIKNLTATAKEPQDHLKLARYYRSAAEALEARAAGYEEAATTYRNSPIVKNFMAPTTPARYEFLAKGFRDEAKADRTLAAAHEDMAKNTLSNPHAAIAAEPNGLFAETK